MALWKVKEITEAISDYLIQVTNNKEFLERELETVHFDNRTFENDGLFIAKKGELTDGHLFIKATLEKGHNNFVIAEKIPENLSTELENRILLVSDSIKAFEALAIFSRARIKNNNAKIIGITGSVGKTTTKDLAKDIFSNFGKTHTNPMSFNSYFGVLTTLCNVPRDTEYLIMEIGMNHHGEMTEITKIIRPTLVTILNIKLAHSEYFKDEQDIAEAKSEIFLGTPENGVALLNKDDKQYSYIKEQALSHKIKVENIYDFGEETQGNLVQLLESNIMNSKRRVTYKINDSQYDFELSNLDNSILYNLMPILGFLHILKLDINKIKSALLNFNAPRGRNNIEEISYEHQGKKIDITLINGSYNAVNPDVFIAGLDLMSNIYNKDKHNRKIAIFGDILEAGNNISVFYDKIKSSLIKHKVDKLYTVGNTIKGLLDNMPMELQGKHYPNSIELAKDIKNVLHDKDIAFVKASKGIKTWKAIDELTGYKTDIFV